MFDVNEANVIGASELRSTILKFGYNIPLEECQDIIDSGDLDGDDKLNFPEFCKVMMETE